MSLPGQALLLCRNVGMHMTTDAVLACGRPVPEHFVDALVPALTLTLTPTLTPTLTLTLTPTPTLTLTLTLTMALAVPLAQAVRLRRC